VSAIGIVVWAETFPAPGHRSDALSLLGERKPNIKSLVAHKDVDGLVDAASYQDPRPGSAGSANNFGASVRAEAILALGTLAPQAGHEAIRAGLHDPADQVRCAAVRILHAHNEVAVLAEALRVLPTDGGHSRKLALQAITDPTKSVSATAVADALVHREDDELLGEHDAQLILALLEGAGPEAAEEAIEVLIRALGEGRGIVVDRAAEMLVRLAPESTEALLRELRDGSAPAEAAYALGRIAHPRTLDALVEGLRNSDPHVRAESAAAMAELQDPAAVGPLLKATRDREHSVRTQAGMALDRLGTIAVIMGVVAQVQPMIREAVRAAIDDPKLGGDRRARPPRPGAHRQSRSRKSNGGPPEAQVPDSQDAP
jgi:HEAT repeat protein